MRPHEIAEGLFRCDHELDRSWYPHILVSGLRGDALVRLFGALQNAAGPWNERDCVWHIERRVELPVATLSNAAELVVSGEGEGFHVVFQDLVHGGIRLPDLGARIDAHGEHSFSLEFDYSFFARRPWDVSAYVWNDAEIDALFDLLAEIRETAPAAQITIDTDFPEDKQETFASALDVASAQRAASRGPV